MFDELPDLDALAAADDAAVAAAIEGWARAEAAAAARRLAAIAELTARRTADPDDERLLWVCDTWDSAAAEVAAALNLSHRRASSQMRLGMSLRERLPAIAQLLADGTLSARTAATISWRTAFVCDTAMARIDAAIAENATRWGPLSDSRLDMAIDAVLAEHDPDALREFHTAARNRDVQFGKPDDSTGTTSMWGLLYNTDAKLLEERLTDMLRGICADDPRTVGQRRSDALGAIAVGAERLACRCGLADCGRVGTDSRAGSVVIHVIADQAAVAAATSAAASAPPLASAATPAPSGMPTTPAPPVAPAASIAPAAPAPVAAPAAPAPATPATRPAVLLGGGVVPGPLLAELIGQGATVTALTPPQATPRYQPSRALDRFIRARDLTCRFPGCNCPAEHTDIDHSIAYPAGQTHPSNLKTECRKHHLLKTFWPGWSDRQYPDGRVEWTSPSGRTFTTYPGSRIVLPQWDIDTGPPPPGSRPVSVHGDRAEKMPKRRRTRAADWAQRVKTERGRHLG